MKKGLLENGVDSIRAGVEDYQSDDEHRIGTAIRNIYGGILLLLKERLRSFGSADDDDAMIKARVLPTIAPDGTVRWVGAGNTTVDFKGLEERFKSLGLTYDFSALARVQRIRNTIEHYEVDHPKAALREAIAASFLLVDSAMREHLEEAPADLLGSAWEAMLTERQLHEKIAADCRAALATVGGAPSGVELSHLECLNCRSSLLRPVEGDDSSYFAVDIACQACGEESSLVDLIPDLLDRTYGWDAYTAAKEGLDDPIAFCPNCHIEAFIVPEDVCGVCGEGRPNTTCLRCAAELSVDESDERLCGYCRHVMDRAMADD